MLIDYGMTRKQIIKGVKEILEREESYEFRSAKENGRTSLFPSYLNRFPLLQRVYNGSEQKTDSVEDMLLQLFTLFFEVYYMMDAYTLEELGYMSMVFIMDYRQKYGM